MNYKRRGGQRPRACNGRGTPRASDRRRATDSGYYLTSAFLNHRGNNAALVSHCDSSASTRLCWNDDNVGGKHRP
eukprot:1178095-Pyramimonas_sp.AAC.1